MTSSANIHTTEPANNNSTKWGNKEAGSHDSKHGMMLLLGNIVIALLLLAGVWSIYEGLGINFRVLEYPDLRAYGIPIGILLLCLALATARFWTFRLDRRGSNPRPVGAPLGTPPGPPPGMPPQMRFSPPGSASANENRAPDGAVSSRAPQGRAAAGESYRA